MENLTIETLHSSRSRVIIISRHIINYIIVVVPKSKESRNNYVKSLKLTM